MLIRMTLFACSKDKARQRFNLGLQEMTAWMNHEHFRTSLCGFYIDKTTLCWRISSIVRRLIHCDASMMICLCSVCPFLLLHQRSPSCLQVIKRSCPMIIKVMSSSSTNILHSFEYTLEYSLKYRLEYSLWIQSLNTVFECSFHFSKLIIAFLKESSEELPLVLQLISYKR